MVSRMLNHQSGKPEHALVFFPSLPLLLYQGFQVDRMNDSDRYNNKKRGTFLSFSLVSLSTCSSLSISFLYSSFPSLHHPVNPSGPLDLRRRQRPTPKPVVVEPSESGVGIPVSLEGELSTNRELSNGDRESVTNREVSNSNREVSNSNREVSNSSREVSNSNRSAVNNRNTPRSHVDSRLRSTTAIPSIVNSPVPPLVNRGTRDPRIVTRGEVGTQAPDRKPVNDKRVPSTQSSSSSSYSCGETIMLAIWVRRRRKEEEEERRRKEEEEERRRKEEEERRKKNVSGTEGRS